MQRGARRESRAHEQMLDKERVDTVETDQIVRAIEQRAALLLARSRLAVANFFLGTLSPDGPEPSAQQVDDIAATRLTAHMILRFAPCWADLVPADAEMRARLCSQLGSRYAFDAQTPALRALLGLDDPSLAAACLHLFGQTPDGLLSNGLTAQTPSAPASDTFLLDDPLVVTEEGLDWVALAPDQVLFRQGDPGDALYIVVTGQVRVLVSYNDQGTRLLGELPAGELVGEMAVITGRPRSATVEACSACELVRVSRTAFDNLLERHPRAMLPVIRLLADRLERRETTLVRQVVELKIEIDQAKRERDAAEIMESEAFREIEEKVHELRARRMKRESDSSSSGPT